MKKIIFLLLVFVNFSYAYSYNDLLLKAQASIFPKILLLDKKIKEKLIDKKIVFTIVYDQSDYLTALEVKKFIDEEYQGYFDEYSYKINLVEFLEFSETTEASAIYVLNSDKYIKKSAELAKNKGVVSFAYELDNLKKGLMFSLVIEKSTVLYLKKENLYTQKIDFVDSLLQMVRFVDQNELYNEILFNNSLNSKTMYAKIMDNIFCEMANN